MTTTRKRDAAVAAARTAATFLRPAATATFRRQESEGGGFSESSLEGTGLEGSGLEGAGLEGARGEDSFLKFMQVLFFLLVVVGGGRPSICVYMCVRILFLKRMQVSCE